MNAPASVPSHQRLGLGDVGLLARRQDELDRVAQGVDERCGSWC